MKMNHMLLLLMVTTLIASCRQNVPEQKEDVQKLLIGQWKVEKETVANGDGFGGIFTRQVNDENILVFDEETMQPESPTWEYDPAPYTLQRQDNGKWLLTVEGYYDQQRNLDDGCSPITIHKLTKDYMEWEFESYGGDEGPVGYYQGLKKLNLSVNNQQ